MATIVDAAAAEEEGRGCRQSTVDKESLPCRLSTVGCLQEAEPLGLAFTRLPWGRFEIAAFGDVASLTDDEVRSALRALRIA